MLNDTDMTQIIQRAHEMRAQVLRDLVIAGWRALRNRLAVTARTNTARTNAPV